MSTKRKKNHFPQPTDCAPASTAQFFVVRTHCWLRLSSKISMPFSVKLLHYQSVVSQHHCKGKCKCQYESFSGTGLGLCPWLNFVMFLLTCSSPYLWSIYVDCCQSVSPSCAQKCVPGGFFP